ncbi:hypothetical protein K3495_g10158 [Podosphaera aphanis]|nr:hypothetical protein K3495_g10158 [Podosphaera aphanis]
MPSTVAPTMKLCSSCRTKLQFEVFGKFKTCIKCRERQRELRKRLTNQPSDAAKSTAHNTTTVAIYRSPYGPPPPPQTIKQQPNSKPHPVVTYQSPYGPPPSSTSNPPPSIAKPVNIKPEPIIKYQSPYGPPPSSG